MSKYVHGMAAFNGRSLPGMHAGEINRTIAFLTARADITHLAGVVALNQTDAAVLHYVAISADFGASPALHDDNGADDPTV
jgi:hypothetical protein